MAVLDLGSGEFVFECDGVSLADEASEVILRRFFSLLAAPAGTSA